MAVQDKEEVQAWWSLAKQERSIHEPTWTEILLYSDPFRGDIITGGALSNSLEGEDSPTKMGRRVFDNSMQKASQRWSNFLRSMVFASKWLRFDIGNVDYVHNQQVRGLLDEAGNKYLRMLSSSNFYIEIGGSYLRDLGNIGNAASWVKEFNQKAQQFSGFVFKSVPMSFIWFSVDENERPFRIARAWKIPAIEAFRFFGEDCGKTCQTELMAKRLMTPIFYLQMVYLNEDGIPGGLSSPKDRPVISQWFDLGTWDQVRLRGYDYMPANVARLQIVNDEVYGRGLGHLARSDFKGVNNMVAKLYKSTDRDLLPPIIAPHEAHLQMSAKSGNVMTMRPVRNGQGFPPFVLNTGSDYNASLSILAMKQKQVGEAYNAEHLAPRDTEPRSAEQSQQNEQQLMAGLGAHADSIKNEGIKPIVLNSAQLAWQRGAIPEFDAIARIIGPFDLDCELVSPFFTAQMSYDLRRLREHARDVSELATITNDPQFLDGLDPDAYHEASVRLGNVPANLVRTKEVIGRIRNARAVDAAMAKTAELQGAGAAGG